jgi:two-component system, chemotaxis family, sensor kinase Cph1
VQQRLGAMARTHERLTESAWRGGDLRTMIKDEIAPYGGETRVTIAGEDIMLKPRAALCIGMAVHELVTNAAKYGALSTAKGRVEIAWGESGAGAERQLRLDWIERGGPPVEPPTRAGFGRTVLERTLAFELGGDVELRFAPQGVRCSAAIPIEEVVP